MAPRSPPELSEEFLRTFNAHDLDGVLALYEPTASFVTPPQGDVVTGHLALRQTLSDFFALKPRMQAVLRKVVYSGDTALMISDWSLTGTSPDGKPVQMSGRASDVLRRQADGTWRVVIDNPVGTA